jgi:hypothetical protein
MVTQDPTKQALDQQLERVGWGLFLIMIGGLAFLPSVPSGTWLVGVGLIMLGVNAARYANGIPMSNFTLVLGAIALLSGLGSMTGLNIPVWPLLLILIGTNIIVKSRLIQPQ